MNRRNNVLTNGPAFREARELKLLTLEAVPDAMEAAGVDCVSKNSVWTAEKGGPISFKTAELLCAFYERNPRVVRLDNGQLFVDPAIVENQLQSVAKTITKMVMADIDGETTEAEVLERLAVLQRLVSDEVIRMTNFKLGSLHFDAEVSLEAAELIDELFDKNDSGEHIVPDLLDDEVYLGLKERLFFRHAKRCLLDEAVEKFAECESWIDFYRHFFGTNGRIRECFPNDSLREKFERSAEHCEMQEMVAALRSVYHRIEHTGEPERMIAVRLPRSVHEALMAEAERALTSVNCLVVSKLIQPIERRLIPQDSRRSFHGREQRRCLATRVEWEDRPSVYLVGEQDEALQTLKKHLVETYSQAVRFINVPNQGVSRLLVGDLLLMDLSDEPADRYIECDRWSNPGE